MKGKSFVAGMGAGAAILGAGMVMGGLQRGGAKAPDPQDAAFRTLSASILQVVNDKGAVVAMVRGSTHGGELALFNNAGKPVLMMGAKSSGGLLEVADQNKQVRVSLDNSGAVTVFGADGKRRAHIASYKSSGNTKEDFSGQFLAFDRNDALVGKIPD